MYQIIVGSIGVVSPLSHLAGLGMVCWWRISALRLVWHGRIMLEYVSLQLGAMLPYAYVVLCRCCLVIQCRGPDILCTDM